MQITVRLPVDMVEKMDEICKKDFSSRSSLFARVVSKYLENEIKKNEPQEKGMYIQK